MHAADPPIQIRATVVILNYNGVRWLEKCLASLREQTIYQHLEIILADNLSTDGSDRLGEALIRSWPNGLFIQHGQNLGYCEGNNRAARQARGEFLFFLNNDTWLEPECLEILLREVRASNAQAATPLVLNYNDSSFQSMGATGFDLFGLPSTRVQFNRTTEVLMPEGCSFLIERRLFEELGGFDPVFFMFSDEWDLSWRVWVTGHKAVAVPAARLHHRGAANVNPEGAGQVVEFRTSDSKRFYANRNALLAVLKNAEHVLLLTFLLQALLLAAEAAVSLLVVKRWSHIQRSYLDAVADCWRSRQHLLSERRRLKTMRRRSDWWMLRFLRLRFNRWDEVVRMIRVGRPKVTEG
jgi:GT2 family glycosyltransferase